MRKRVHMQKRKTLRKVNIITEVKLHCKCELWDQMLKQINVQRINKIWVKPEDLF